MRHRAGVLQPHQAGSDHNQNRGILSPRVLRSYELTKTLRSKPETESWRNSLESLLSKLSRPDVLKPLVLMTLLMFFQQFAGTATISYYAYEVMASTGSSIDQSDATIIYGVVRLLATLIGALLLRRFARRPLLVVSALCVCLGMIVLGYTTHHNNNNTGGTEEVFVTNYLPLIAVNFIAVSYQFGLGPVGWSYTGQIDNFSSTHIRNLNVIIR